MSLEVMAGDHVALFVLVKTESSLETWGALRPLQYEPRGEKSNDVFGSVLKRKVIPEGTF